MNNARCFWLLSLVWLLFNRINAQIAPFSKTQFEHYADQQGLYSRYILSIAQDHLGFIWLGTRGALYRFDGHQFLEFQHDPENPSSLPATNIRFIYEDREHILWLGSGGEGLSRLDPKTGDFTNYKNDPNDPNSLTNNAVLTALEDRRGNFWLGTARGLFLMDRKKGSFQKMAFSSETFTERPNYLHIQTMTEDSNGNLWLGSIDAGLFRFDLSTYTFESVPLPFQDKISGTNADFWITSIIEDSFGKI